MFTFASESALIKSQTLSHYLQILLVVITGQYYAVSEGGDKDTITVTFTWYFWIPEIYLTSFFYVSPFINGVK